MGDARFRRRDVWQLVDKKGARDVQFQLDKYKDLKLQLDGFLKPGEQHKRNVLLDSVYASLPKDLAGQGSGF